MKYNIITGKISFRDMKIPCTSPCFRHERDRDEAVTHACSPYTSRACINIIRCPYPMKVVTSQNAGITGDTEGSRVTAFWFS